MHPAGPSMHDVCQVTCQAALLYIASKALRAFQIAPSCVIMGGTGSTRTSINEGTCWLPSSAEESKVTRASGCSLDCR